MTLAAYITLAARRSVAVERPGLSPPSYRLVFVAGAARSGTTWVTDMLQSHPRVGGANESHAALTLRDPLLDHGVGFRAFVEILTRFDSPILRDRSTGLHGWTTRRRLSSLLVWAASHHTWSAARVADEVIAAVFDDFAAHRLRAGADVVVEKTPEHLFLARRLLDLFPTARIVEVVRDGRDMATSKHARGLATGNASGNWTDAQLRGMAERWVRYVTFGESLRSDPAYADRIHRVRFEDLKQQPVAEMRSILRFLDVAADDATVETVVGENEFARQRSGFHRRKGEVGDWQTRFSEHDTELFDAVAGPTLERQGYQRRP